MTSDLFPLGIAAKIGRNAGDAELIERAILQGEAHFTANGALAVETGMHTGRSVQDKFTVRDAATETSVWWDNNRAMTPEHFDVLLGDFREYSRSRELYVQDLFVGADPRHRLKVRIFLEYAWHALFMRNLLRKPQPAELVGFEPDVTIVNLPGFRADPRRHGVRSETVIACHFPRRMVLIGGTS